MTIKESATMEALYNQGNYISKGDILTIRYVDVPFKHEGVTIQWIGFKEVHDALFQSNYFKLHFPEEVLSPNGERL